MPKSLGGKAQGVLRDDEDVVEIPLNDGRVATCDYADYHLVKDYVWRAQLNESGMTYAVSTSKKTGKSIVYMHNLIMGIPEDETIYSS